MSGNPFSPYWHRVAELRPRLRAHVQLHRHRYRGRIWYVFQDHASGRFHRFTPAAYRFIGLLDGHCSVDEAWKRACAALGDEALSQGQTIQLLAQLYRADVLVTDVPPDTAELFERQRSTRRQQLLRRWKSPLAIRVPLVDPDRFVEATMPLGRVMFSLWGLLLWCAAVGGALVLGFVHWPELTDNALDRILAGHNILILLLTFPFVKILHELGHAYTTRLRGGEVHEMGIMFLILMPIPYIDASAASAFQSKWSRALVGSAGMMVELFLAAIAMLVWTSVEPGLVRAVAFNVIIIAGVSTILFNGNPLIRFDGYYVLSDLIEIPNLGTRATRYLGYLAQRYLLRVDNAVSPVMAPGERGWFVFYGVASFLYRMFLVTVIVFLLVDQYFVVGVVLAIWAVVLMVVMPLFKQIKFLASDRRLRGRRPRAMAVSAAGVALIAAIALIPLPSATVAEGIVWADRDDRVRLASDGFVDEVLVESGEPVEAGQVLVRLRNPSLQAELERLEAQLRELRARYDLAASADAVQTDLVREQIDGVGARLESVRAQAQALTVRSPASGRLILTRTADLEDRFLHRGAELGVVAEPRRATARVVVPQERIGLVRQRTRSVAVRMARSPGESVAARVRREVPAATARLPSPALALEGGGGIAVDPRRGEAGGRRAPVAFESLFQLDLEMDRPAAGLGLGERVYARFDHGTEPLGVQLYRSVRQTFLERFGV